jgi:DNA invertase Pin-like site-specific DNA recombinase
MRAAIYARVSTFEQHVENQLQELRTYCERRGWAVTEFVDRGVSGAKDRRPALDEMLKLAKRRKFDVLVCWRLDRLGRNLRHLILLLDELHALGVAFVSLSEGIDATTPAGRLQLHVLGAIAEFERARIQERVRAGMKRARAQGKQLGRPRKRPGETRLAEVAHLPIREAAQLLGVSRSTVQRLRSRHDHIPRSVDVESGSVAPSVRRSRET